MDFIASVKISDVLRAKNIGEPVNAHIVELPREPLPDYDAMEAMIRGTDNVPNSLEETADAERRKVSPLR